MQKKSVVIILFLYFLGIVYLILPPPVIPALPNSFKSDEPGDTGQIPNVIAAYYTNATRAEVIRFYTENFRQSSFLSLPLLTYKLNHPPEYSREIIIDTLQSSFFEELVHPLRESLFINGYKIKIRDKKGKIKQSYAIRQGKKYKNKVTLYYIESSRVARIVVFTLIVLSGFVLGRALGLILQSPWKKR